MLIRFAAAVLALSCTVPAAWAQQAPVQRARAGAFQFALTPYLGIGWRGARAQATGVEHRMGSGPALGLGLQIPLPSVLGVSVNAMVSRPKRVTCFDGICGSFDPITAIRASAVLLFRFKARAPIYFGFGAAAERLDPGPVVSQPDPITEYGAVAVVGYDLALSSRVGGRIAWWNYLMTPNGQNLSGTTVVKGTTYDTLITVGARIVILGR